ncbi:MFS transporter [Alkalihalobacillus trypoxylicola]|uniref:Major facilitator superfamily (MFS) profile domain-containing protein n=1 Tax=Alkalihalobacillus trypoxylicola TaxID=519424 RepID=A0A161QD72_9BACI|nr:MFS transporter [Alkalihalobacillus trypoxylicola]KYG26095.1 hypothetical protein AZF04_13500 [Alkalihalobacillus trypoxylicola]
METKQSIFKQTNFLKLWLSQSFNSLAQILIQVIVMVEVYQRTESATGPALVLATMSLTLFVSSILASYYIERFPLKRILHASGWLKGVSAISVGYFLYLDSSVGFILMFVSLVGLSFLNAWYSPARFAFLPLVVTKNEYIKANGTLVMIDQLLATAGWALGAVLSLYIPLQILIGMMALLFISSGILIQTIRLSSIQKATPKVKLTTPAWKELWNIKVVRGITIMDSIEAIANAIWTSALILAFTKVVLGVGEQWWGFINAAYFVGAILGSLLVTFKADRFSSRIGVMIGCSGLSMGILTILFALNTNPVMALILCVLMGPMYQARDICQVALLQDAIPEQRRASIMAARSSFLTPLSGVMVLVIGVTADLIGVQFVYLLAGAAYFIVSLLAFKWNELREYKLNSPDTI